MRILVVCYSSRSIVCSAKKAGYTVYALDNFGDVDMRGCADKAEFLGNASGDRIYELARSFGDFDAVVLGPGFEKLRFRNILNNRLSVMEEVNDKLKIAKKFESMDIPHPDTELLTKASGAGFPLMIKPRFGSGGMLNITARDEDELADLKARDDACNFIAQEFVEGTPCSASLIGTGDDAAVIALNEQLIGVPGLTRLPFAYCGNITPFRTGFSDEMVQYAARIAREFSLVGSNGVDFILTEKGAVAIEVNPRFQGSLDTIELSTGMNVFDAHVRSFEGELPLLRDFSRYAAKAILYTDRRLIIDQKLSDRLTGCMNANNAADIPQAGCVISPDEPVATLLGTGETREIALGNASKYAYTIRAMSEA
ncbi:MAG: ATP-grasp domain-containing protein [Candidatus Methanoperedens sp.]|nr:ATP-grasp domain-containing protein [Candidatus Methanoperedens sp.]